MKITLIYHPEPRPGAPASIGLRLTDEVARTEYGDYALLTTPHTTGDALEALVRLAEVLALHPETHRLS